MSLTTSDAQKLRELFDKYDDDKNGGLDINEFKNFLTEAGEEFDDEDLNELYAVFDHDHNGLLAFDEFVDYVGCIESGDERRLIEYRFKSIDTDDNGVLDASELQQFQKLCGNIITLEQAEELLKEIDCNGDGKVTLEDYIKYSE
ncbi:EF hand family protein [Trichomonas vaginalis G3]|uniref:EF hand family protein n=1 Tax=Trichomonas vaginalis (strain ATCC PRA-98 / G3) TaxID=412133 RepID=A2DPU6_TRIV3|nr:calcium ion binding [Trichomonas vaginalis G3]EAY17542.1 EF hand family protein [Trichomonas vaginalis G3]KAI5520586.1 calcium ion binding [Trichomonas vaginalis G3]|eukprot:XP_001329677.1 EF hand family protein [Trichomonas vaginalis G3]